MKNIGQIIKTHNKKILGKKENNNEKCNCQQKQNCPLKGNCLVKNVIYAARVIPQNPTNNQQTADTENPTTTTQTTSASHNYSLRNRSTNNTSNQTQLNPNPTETRYNNKSKIMTYIGCAEDFKSRYRNHLKSFRNPRYEKETALSKHIHQLEKNKVNFSIEWNILKRTSGFNKITKSCSLCTSEKMEICKFKLKENLLNKRNELVSKCRHANKYLLSNLPDP